jgi:hypothetical protein
MFTVRSSRVARVQITVNGAQNHINFGAILGAFAKLRKAPISFVMSSVCPSVRMVNLGSDWSFIKFDVSGFFENLSRIFKFH